MATLQNIRNRGALIAVVIGFALLSFILGDLFTSGSKLFSASQFEIAEISGESVSYQEFQQQVEKLTRVQEVQRRSSLDAAGVERVRNQTWEDMVKRYVMQPQYDELGIAISTAELSDMVQGNNIHPIVRQSFTNSETGQFNPAAVAQFIQNMEQDPSGNSKLMWLYIEKEIQTDRLYSKYMNLVKKGLFVTDAEAQDSYKERTHIVDFNYVAQKYTTLADSAVSITDADLEAYYEKHENDFKQEATRDVVYVAFEVLPSADDNAAAEKWITQIKVDFENTENDIQFTNSNSDVPFKATHFKQGELPENIDSLMFTEELGYIYGPYFKNGSFKLAKLLERVELSDSVKARHILIAPNQTLSMEQAKFKIDSLKALIEAGADFAELAKTNSQDGSAKEGGDLGWFTEGRMVKPFNDACFFAAKGDLMTVNTQFGVHLIEVLDKTKAMTKVQVAIIERKVEPSSATFQMVYSDASKFAGENNTAAKFETAVEAQGLTKRIAANLTAISTRVPGLNNARELVRWAFKDETKKNDVSTVFEFGNKYVVAVLNEIREKGIAPLEAIRTEIEVYVRQEKKAETMLKNVTDKIAGSKDLNSIAATLNSEVQEAKNISFSSTQVLGAGLEFELIAQVVNLKKGELSAPIKGKNAIYVAQVSSVTEAPANENVQADRNKIEKGLQSRATYQAFDAMRKSADVVDNRGKFY